jgi:transposase
MQLFEIALDVPGVKIEKVETNEKKDIIITVKSTVTGTICHKCGRRTTKPYGSGRFHISERAFMLIL